MPLTQAAHRAARVVSEDQGKNKPWALQGGQREALQQEEGDGRWISVKEEDIQMTKIIVSGGRGTWEQCGCLGNRGDVDKLQETQGSWGKEQKKCMGR